MGIKEVPTKNLIPKKTHIFFSHTHKGQSYNMNMLQDILDKVKSFLFEFFTMSPQFVNIVYLTFIVFNFFFRKYV